LIGKVLSDKEGRAHLSQHNQRERLWTQHVRRYS
jgi:hypothetical protein